MSTGSEHYLVGTAGNPNFGDEFITASWLRFLAVNAPDAVVWLDCPRPGAASLLFEGLHPGLRITDTLWRAVRDSDGLPPAEVGRRVRHLVHCLGSPNYDMGLVRLRQASSLHLLGGGYVNGVWPHHAALVSGMKAVKELTGARLYATGQGLMPLIGTPQEAAGLFQGFDRVRSAFRSDCRREFLSLHTGVGRRHPGGTGPVVAHHPVSLPPARIGRWLTRDRLCRPRGILRRETHVADPIGERLGPRHPGFAGRRGSPGEHDSSHQSGHFHRGEAR